MNIFGSHTFKEADRLSFKDSGHGDSDPGDSDQDTTRGSYNEMVGRDAAIAQQLAEDPGAVMPDDQGTTHSHALQNAPRGFSLTSSHLTL